MDRIDKNELDIYYTGISGGYADIYMCYYNNYDYAYKKFSNKYYFKTISDKIEHLGNIKLKNSVLPEYIVYDGEESNIITYLSKWYDLKNMCDLYYRDEINEFSKKIQILKNIRNSIIELHDNDIIHGDIHMGNILVNKKTLKTKLIDFDNCNYKNFSLNVKNVTDIALAYLYKYGMNKGLDIFLLNRLTLELLYNISNKFFDREVNYMYGEFKYDEKVKKAVDTLLFMSSKPSDDFLIDTSLVKKLEGKS